MATINKQLVASLRTANQNTPQSFYLSPLNGGGTIITNFTASNDTTTTSSYKAYIVLEGKTPIIPVVPDRNIVENRADVSAEMAGQLMPAGSTLQMETSIAASIAFTVSGRELS